MGTPPACPHPWPAAPSPSARPSRGAPHLVITFRGAPAHDLGVLGVGGALLGRHRGGGSCRGGGGRRCQGGPRKRPPGHGSAPSCRREGLHRPGSAADFSLFSRQHQKAPPRLTASRMRVRTMYPDLEKVACPPARAESGAEPGDGWRPPHTPPQQPQAELVAPKGAQDPPPPGAAQAPSPPLRQMACRSKRTTFWSAGLLTVQA